MIGKIVLGIVAITVGLVLITPVKDMLGKFLTIMNNTYTLTDFEYMIWLVMPLVLFVFIFVAAVWGFRGHGGDEGEE